MVELLIRILTVVLLASGVAARTWARKPTHGSRPFWKARRAFESQRQYGLYVYGTLAIVAGALLLAAVSIARSF